MSTRKRYAQELERAEELIARAFVEAAQLVASRASLAEVEAAIAARDFERLVRATGIDGAAAGIVTEAVRTAFVAGALLEAENLRTIFNIRSTAAETWLAKRSSELVTLITETQKEAIREALADAVKRGRGPRQTALDIVGKINRKTGKREGGIVGLNAPQTQYVINARTELQELDLHYFTRSRRDRRFDATVMRSITEEKPLSSADIDRIVSRYSDRLLQSRGVSIARTESIEALNAGREQAIQQAVISGEIPPQFILRIWEAANDSRTRHNHAEMHGQKRPVGQPFQSPDHSLLMFPGDTSLGAKAHDVINCRCYMRTQIDHIGLAAYRAGGTA